ncbi:RICIN domain-containing protein [Winogradskyella echinorum]|uniref:RICIN domain-containing protein n=1 Tax=Winogradskyella echinorum TaxID=538189 RepID=A0ABR6Y3G1_9FLAO|nr:RICIN domain-containing protein [Winogradskyella echinorum]MBC3846768.1 RICIN domain-containing protein [Winogradskyella echinorum]MBC5751116.1 RICIN domain-containing protein [Winogradskyella echinorum]
MNLSIKRNKISTILIGISVFTILGVAPYFIGPGLTQPEAVGTFLNGNFPDVTASAQPYQPAFPNLTFDSPLTFTNVPNTNVIILGQRNGEIYWFENDESVTTKNLVADLSNEVGVVWDGGFLGLAIHPEFGTPGKNYFYTYYTSKDGNGNDYPNAFLSGFGCYQEDYWGGFLYLRRYEVNPTTYTVVPGSELTMLKMRMFSSTHRGGSMDFGNDGFLYLATGEQSAYTKPQNITTNLDGGVLRIDVDQDPTKSHAPIRKLDTGRFNDEISGVGYGIPNDNPFLSPSGQNFEEYYTIGHRNPHRMTKDKLTGTFYIGEIGESTHEEVNIVSRGKNYGWPVYEGYATGPGAGCGGADSGMYNNMPHEGPLVAFPRAEANALMGGYVYRGTDMPDFYGKYICADYGAGEEIWSVDINTGEYDLITAFSPTNIIGFGEDNSGELYLLSQGNNVFLYKLSQVNQSPLDAAPQLLSQTGAFQDLQTLTPNSGVIPYDLIESFWSDGAIKKRWMVIPNDGTHDTPQEKISFSENGDWEFPVGSVLIKHFELPIDDSNPSITKRLETRFSVKASTGNFYYLTYKWNADETDAVLLDSGIEETIQITTEGGSTRNQTWTYPGTQDCISCHNPATKGTLGPRTRYLNSDITYPTTSITANQLVTLSHLGILDETIDDNTVLGYQTYKAKDDPNATLDEKARSYLDLNCAYCHRPGGTGDRAQFDLRLSNSLVQTGLMYAGTNTPLGIPGERIIVGGDASKSILFHRTESVDQTIAMPPIAKNVADQQGVDLVEEWINQLEPNYENPTINASTYVITNVGSGLAMDIAGISNDNFADVQQWNYVSGANQQFIVTPVDGTSYTIKAVHSNKNIDVQAQGQDPGTNVIQYQENGTVAQLFSFEYLGNDQYAIRSTSNGLYLGIENNSVSNGGSIKTYNNDGSDFFKWTFTDLLYEPVTGVTVTPTTASVFTEETISLTASVLPNDASEQGIVWSSSDESIAIVDATGTVTGISEGTVSITATTVEGAFTDTAQITVYEGSTIGVSVYTITNVGSTLVMDVFDQSQDNLADVIQWTSNLGENQQFIIAPAEDNYFTIKAVHSNKNLDVLYAGQDPGTNLIQYEENGTDAQLFSLEYLGNDEYAIKSKVNGLYLGIENNSLSNGASVKTYPNDGSDFFKWTFTDLRSNDCTGLIVDHTDPVGTGIITARGEINEAENKFKAFDNKKTQNDFSKWLDNTGVPSVSNPSFISIEFVRPQYVNQLIITSANDVPDRDPENFRILGSNGGAYTELGVWTGEQFYTRYQSKYFVFSNTTAYTTYRIEITKNLGNIALTQLAEIELLGCDSSPISTTYTYDNGWLPSDPNGLSYANDSIIVNSGEAVISSNTICNDFTVSPGAALTVDNGVTLLANTTTLQSTSQSFASLIANGTVDGNIKYVRYVNANSGGNDLISPPLSGQTWEDFLLTDTNAEDILNDGNDNPRTYLFGPFDKAVDWYVNYTDETSTTLDSGKGYRAATVSGTTLTFTGNVLTTPVTVDIVNSGANYPDWNLIGNPYPSYISIADFLNYETAPNVKNIDLLEDISGIYGYDGNASNGWDVITLANAGNRLMAPGQGFLVAASLTHVDDYDITFDTSLRVIGSDDDFIQGRNTNVLTFLKLKASTSNNEYSTEFYFDENASLGLDRGYDGKILGSVAPNFALYSHLVQDNSELPIALQALNPSDLTNTIIPLGVNANQGEQITFSISETTLPSNVEVYLEDTESNTITLLNSNDYIITPNMNLNGTGRFYLHFTSSVLSVGNNVLDGIHIYTTSNPKSLIIEGELEMTTGVYLYDIQGRLVLNKSLMQSSLLNTIDIASIGTGVYFVKVTNDYQSKTQKIIIK